jgi:hypothetical protein
LNPPVLHKEGKQNHCQIKTAAAAERCRKVVSITTLTSAEFF